MRVFAKLARAGDKLPHPQSPRLFDASGEYIDGADSYWASLLRDGSLVLATGPAPRRRLTRRRLFLIPNPNGSRHDHRF